MFSSCTDGVDFLDDDDFLLEDFFFDLDDDELRLCDALLGTRE